MTNEERKHIERAIWQLQSLLNEDEMGQAQPQQRVTKKNGSYRLDYGGSSTTVRVEVVERVYTLIAALGGPRRVCDATQAHLAELLGITPADVSKAVFVLVDDGRLRRKDDRRAGALEVVG